MENKGVTRGGFALLAKVLAGLVAIAAFSVLRLPEPPARLIIMAIPGAGEGWLQPSPSGGGTSSLLALRETGFYGNITDLPEGSGSRFWHQLVTEAATIDGDSIHLERAIWEPLGSRIAVIGAPLRLMGDAPAATRTMLTMQTETAFVGGSAGVLAQAKDLAAGQIPAPYDASSDRVIAAVETLADGQWSEWIGRSGERNGQFQIGRLSRTDVWLSPVYKTFPLGTNPPTAVLLGEPFIRGMDADAGNAMVEHLAAVQASRSTAAERMVTSSSDVRTVILFYTLGSNIVGMSAPTPPPASNLERFRQELDRTLAKLRAAAPGPSTVLMIGGPDLGREHADKGWYLMSDGRGSGTPLDLDFQRVRVLLRYLLGTSVNVEERRILPPAMLARFPVRASSDVVPMIEGDRRELPWSVETLDKLGRPAGS